MGGGSRGIEGQRGQDNGVFLKAKGMREHRLEQTRVVVRQSGRPTGRCSENIESP